MAQYNHCPTHVVLRLYRWERVYFSAAPLPTRVHAAALQSINTLVQVKMNSLSAVAAFRSPWYGLVGVGWRGRRTYT